MTYITYPCWAFQSQKPEQEKCRICSPRPSRKNNLRKPQNLKKSEKISTIAAATLTLLYNLYINDPTVLRQEFNTLCSMSKDEPALEHNVPPLTIIPHKASGNTPSVVLHGAEMDRPTMCINTFNDVGGEEVESSCSLRILPNREKPVKKQKKKKQTKEMRLMKCYEAAWASAYFANGMSMLGGMSILGSNRNRANRNRAKRNRTNRA